MAVAKQLQYTVLNSVAQAFMDMGHLMSVSDIVGKSLKKPNVRARRIVCYILRNSYHHDVISIGNVLNIDHSTVTYHCKTADYELTMYYDLAELYRRSVALIGCNIPTWIKLCTEPKGFAPSPTPKVRHRPMEVDKSGEWVRPMHWNQKQRAELAAWRKQGER
jgi:hypothetical protein